MNGRFSISASYLYGFYEIWITFIYRPYCVPFTMELCSTLRHVANAPAGLSGMNKEILFLWVSARNSCKANLDDKMRPFQTSSCTASII